MLKHKTARSQKRVFSIGWGGGPGTFIVNADQEGILRAPPANRGDPLETGVPIEQTHPEMKGRLFSTFPTLIEDLDPDPVPDEEDQGTVPIVPEGRQTPRRARKESETA